MEGVPGMYKVPANRIFLQLTGTGLLILWDYVLHVVRLLHVMICQSLSPENRLGAFDN